MMKPCSAVPRERRISSLPPRCWRRLAASAAVVLAIGLPLGGAIGQETEGCKDLLTRFNRLIDLYIEAGSRAIDKGEEPAKALEAARARALKGDTNATVTLVGVTLLIYGRRDNFPVSIIRQICNLAARNAMPQHVVTCAYLNALNPLGDKDDKRQAVEAEITRFEKSLKPLSPGSFAPPDEYRVHIDALKICLPRA
jgi:hypothetical protein